MASAVSSFSSALFYALSCVGKPGLVLKDKQLEALKCLYSGSDVFLWVPTGYGKSICSVEWPELDFTGSTSCLYFDVAVFSLIFVYTFT